MVYRARHQAPPLSQWGDMDPDDPSPDSRIEGRVGVVTVGRAIRRPAE